MASRLLPSLYTRGYRRRAAHLHSRTSSRLVLLRRVCGLAAWCPTPVLALHARVNGARFNPFVSYLVLLLQPLVSSLFLNPSQDQSLVPSFVPSLVLMQPLVPSLSLNPLQDQSLIPSFVRFVSPSVATSRAISLLSILPESVSRSFGRRVAPDIVLLHKVALLCRVS